MKKGMMRLFYLVTDLFGKRTTTRFGDRIDTYQISQYKGETK